MGKLVTLQTLRDDIRFRYDIAPTSSRLTDVQLDRLINASRDSFNSLFIDSDETVRETSTTLSTTAGVDSVPLPEGFHALIDVKADVDGFREPLRKATQDEVGGSVQTYQWSERLPVYRLGQGVIHFWPTPQGTHQVQLRYLEAFGDLVLDTDTWDAHASWVEWLTLDVAIRIRTRDRSYEDVQVLKGLQREEEERVRSSITSMDRASPNLIRRIADSGRYQGPVESWDE